LSFYSAFLSNKFRGTCSSVNAERVHGQGKVGTPCHGQTATAEKTQNASDLRLNKNTKSSSIFVE